MLWDRFPHGDELGGAPANVAFHLAGLGESSALVTRVGDDADGELARARLREAGVDVRCVQVDTEWATGEVGVDIGPDGDARYTLFRERAWQRIECGDAERELLATARGFCFGTLAQGTAAGRSGHLSALAALPDSAIVVCDPNLRGNFADWDLLRDSVAAADVVKLNEDEAAAVSTHLAGGGPPLPYLFALGCQLVALTLGPRGCHLTHASGQTASHPGFPARPGGDNVGCGDAFTAALLASLTAGAPLSATAATANRLAAHVASHRGATP